MFGSALEAFASKANAPEPGGECVMTEFTKTKIHFALALLAAIFALHPFLHRWEDWGFWYLGFEIKLYYAYLLVAGLLSLCVYCYGLTLFSERTHAGLEKLGNYLYALAAMTLPLLGGLYLSSLLAERMGRSELAWAAPGVALGLGIAWLLLSQAAAWLVRGRLADQDRTTKVEQWAKQEIVSVNHASELFTNGHYDLAVIEAWRAMDARLRRVLMARSVTVDKPQALIQATRKAGIVSGPAVGLLEELKQHWRVAMSSEPLTREAASAALSNVRYLLSIIPLPEGTISGDGHRDHPLRLSA
jgi:hypothetical protein